MKRTGRKYRRRPEKQPQSGTHLDADSPPRPRPSDRRFLIEMAVCVIATLIFLHFLNRANDAAGRDCEARGGTWVVNQTSHRCVFPGEPVAP